jgi:hypothetical protein
MSISTFKKDFVNLDSFYNFEDKNPLLKSLTNDLLDNGFKDVGPSLTKITISDEDFIRFIDEFIIYHYNTEQESTGKGAYGIRPWNVGDTHLKSTTAGGAAVIPGGVFPKTVWKPEGQTVSVEIDDFYKDGFGTWDGSANPPAAVAAGTYIPASPYYNVPFNAGETDGATGTTPIGCQKSLDGTQVPWHKYLSSEFPLNGEDAVGPTSVFGLDYHTKYGAAPTPSNPPKSVIEWSGPALEPYNGAVWDNDPGGAVNIYETVNQVVPPVLVEPSTDPADVYIGGVPSAGINYAASVGTGGTGWVGQDYYNSNLIFGPNTELFSFLNPHPQSMVVGANGRGVYRKGSTYSYNLYTGTANPPAPGVPAAATDPGGKMNWNPGYHGLGDIGRAVYMNEFTKIKNTICTGHRGVTMSPDNTKSTFKRVTKYFERILPSGEIQHEFYLAGENDSTFFPPNTVEDVRQVVMTQFGITQITGQTYGLQLGDIYTLNFVMQDLEASTPALPVIETFRTVITVSSIDSVMFTQDLYHTLLNGTLASKSNGYFDISLSEDISSTLQFESKEPKHKLVGIGSWGQLSEFNINLSTISPIIDGSIEINFNYPSYPTDRILIKLNTSDTVSIIRNKIHLALVTYKYPESIIIEVDDDLTNASVINLKMNRLLTSMTVGDVNTAISSPWTTITATIVTPYSLISGGFNDNGVNRYVPIKDSFSPIDQVLSTTAVPPFVNDFASLSVPIQTTSGSVISWNGSTTNPVSVYKNGYIPSMRIGPFNEGQDGSGTLINNDGMNGGDKISITITGLVNEDSATPWTDVTGHSIYMTFEAENNLTTLETLLALKNFMLIDEYIYTYMTVIVDGNFIVLSYNYKSSAYMVRSKRAPGDLGLLNIPSNYWDTDLGQNATTVATYNSNSIIGSGYLVSPDVNNTIFKTARNYGDVVMGLDYDAIVVTDISTIGTSSITSSGFKSPDFDIGVNFIVKSPRLGDALHNKVTEIKSSMLNSESKIRISFHYANDFGTFANPPTITQHLFYSPWESGNENSAREFCSYSESYKQAILQTSYTRRPTGPNCSFRDVFKTVHPWMTTNTDDEFDDYPKYTGVCYFDSFRKITDHSIGPVVLETDDSNPMIGMGDRQPFRIRFDVVSGSEVMDTSQYISSSHRAIDLNDQTGVNNIVKSSNRYDYLQVNIATKYQLKGDGTVTDITKYTSEVPKGRMVRPSGFLSDIKTQYDMYSKSQAHIIDPRVNRSLDDAQINTLININAGRVGYRSNVYSLNPSDLKKREYQFNMTSNPVHNNRTNAPSFKFNSMDDTHIIYKGILEDSEYKYENSWLRGSSMELLEDAPYNTTYSRMGKGWFKRDGKVDEDVRGQYPMNYHLTILNHGISLYIQDQAASTEADDFAWFVVQRHVDQVTGEPDWVSDTQPIHCIYMTSKHGTLWSNFTPYFNNVEIDVNSSMMSTHIFNSTGEIINDFWIEDMKNPEYNELDIDLQSRFKRFVVREIDTVKPWDKHVYAGINSIDSHAVINPLEQISFNEDGKLIIHFPTKLSNQRVIFGSSELDMIAFTDAGAVNEDSFTSSTRYGVTKERFYKGGMSTRPYGNGMRILFLVSGYGVQSNYGFVVD